MVTAGTIARAVWVQKTKYLIFRLLENLKQHFSEMESFNSSTDNIYKMPGKEKHQCMAKGSCKVLLHTYQCSHCLKCECSSEFKKENIPTVEGGDAVCLRLTGAEQLIVWLILNSTHLLLDILSSLILPVTTHSARNCVYKNHCAFESFAIF